jgi:hypothetical protein
MFDHAEKERLKQHVIQLTASLVQQIDRDGIIRSYDSQGNPYPDLPVNHHLVEHLLTLNSDLFRHYVNCITSWMADPENGSLTHPFVVDTLAQAHSDNDSTEQFIRDTLVSEQLADGSIVKYNSALGRGDYFSTLWSTKIMMNYSKSVFYDEISLAISYLLDRKDVAATDIGQVGFLALLLMQYSLEEYIDTIQSLIERLVSNLKDVPRSESSLSLISRIYVLEDLFYFAEANGDEETAALVQDEIHNLFDLNKDVTEIPNAFAEAQETYSQSLFYQTLARSCRLGSMLVALDEPNELPLQVNTFLHNKSRTYLYAALESQAELKYYISNYGSIHKKFSQYDDILEEIWKDHPFEKSIFIMMPFRDTNNYRTLTREIKKACSKQGFKAIRVDDGDRQFVDTLWDNLVINMLSCKYGIAVYASDTVVDRLRNDEVRLFSNPNVALEYGFFRSRGQEVLLLKDENSKLPSDLQGFVWKSFDIKNADKTVEDPVRTWIAGLEDAEGHENL